MAEDHLLQNAFHHLPVACVAAQTAKTLRAFASRQNVPFTMQQHQR
jgi:hypothetical protein